MLRDNAGSAGSRTIAPPGGSHSIVVTILKRVAVLSDIHGVLPALDVVLGEPEVHCADRVVLTGASQPVRNQPRSWTC